MGENASHTGAYLDTYDTYYYYLLLFLKVGMKIFICFKRTFQASNLVTRNQTGPRKMSGYCKFLRNIRNLAQT